MIPAKPLDRAIYNIKYRLGKYYVRMGLTPPKLEYVEIFQTPPSPRDPYVINEWPLRSVDGIKLKKKTKNCDVSDIHVTLPKQTLGLGTDVIVTNPVGTNIIFFNEVRYTTRYWEVRIFMWESCQNSNLHTNSEIMMLRKLGSFLHCTTAH